MYAATSSETIDGDVAPAASDPAVFRPVQYLGSKLRVLDDIVGMAGSIVHPGASVADLFTGSTVVAQALAARRYSVTAVDTQAYSICFATALLGIGRARDKLDYASVVAQSSEHQLGLLADWRKIAAAESSALAVGDAESVRKLHEELPLAWREGKREADPQAPLCSFYAGTYFGVGQALQLDALLAAIATIDSEGTTWIGAALRTALMHTASLVVHSAGKHFAQPLKARPQNAGFLDQRMLSDRSLDVLKIFAQACKAIAARRPQPDLNHSAHRAEAERYIAASHQRHDLYYLDPPYTAQQYSRFYHVLETIATGALPSLAPGPITSGLYPAGRYKSAFSSRRRAGPALAAILERVAAEEAAAIISYSASQEESDGNARMIGFSELICDCHDFFGRAGTKIVELDHRYRQFNSGENANKRRDDREVLVICKRV